MADRRPELNGDEPVHRPVVGALICAAFVVPAAVALLGFAAGDRPLPAIARRAMEDSLPRFRTTEAVSGVVYGFRGFDTFGETFLLLAAVVSVVLVGRRREVREGFVGEELAAEHEQPSGSDDDSSDDEQQARAAERQEEGADAIGGPDDPDTPDVVPLGLAERERAHAMTVLTRTALRTVLPFLLVAGCYLVAIGYSPGGGFPAGVAIVGVGLLAYAGFGYPAISRVLSTDVAELVEVVGALAVIALFVVGVPAAGSFGGSWVPLAPVQTIRSGGIVQAFSVTELVEVASGLMLAVLALLLMEHDWARQDRHEESGEDQR
jgi:multicomponent Na+:H+ antiporter subunit B